MEGPRFFGSRQPYRPLAERPDVLAFQTPPLAQGTKVTGPIVSTLWVASDCPDTDITISCSTSTRRRPIIRRVSP
jgi:predicted acyl esterase